VLTGWWQWASVAILVSLLFDLMIASEQLLQQGWSIDLLKTAAALGAGTARALVRFARRAPVLIDIQEFHLRH
jgi:hypothetical protein